MEKILKDFLEILEYADMHDGIVAMLGIAVTVIIFHREVANNFYSLERQNFNEVFSPAYKEIPKKIKKLENANQERWNNCFQDLLDSFMKMLDEANYFRYKIPYLYKILEIYIGEIEDLSRHDNWRIYRCSERQLQLITRKSRRIVKTIDNASKGKRLFIKLKSLIVFRKIRSSFMYWLVDRPCDRIASSVMKSSCSDAVTFNKTLGGTYSLEDLKNLERGYLQVCPKSEITNVRIIPVQKTARIYFGYIFNLYMGKRISKIVLKTSQDKKIRIQWLHHIANINWEDDWVHKLVITWEKADDNIHLFYDIVKVKQRL